MPDSCHSRGRSGDAITAKSQRFTPGDLLGSGEHGTNLSVGEGGSLALDGVDAKLPATASQAGKERPD
jgi:hypothetical protein